MKSMHEHIASELAILNSNPYFNVISKDKEQLTAQDIAAELKDAEHAGAERYIIREQGNDIGILEFLMHNPNDSCTWIGLLVIHGAYHGRGYGNAALALFDTIMRERGVTSHRLGVLASNAAAHAFWQRNGCIPVKPAVLPDGKDIMIYERTVD
ncbi:GNAT family N-acetyltransferase [Paenibacillus sp. CF384]|uniref:GNAT family N-acetyltransferase n=1 Tax=Paenibacillus sp. CF384 TaxID=1884382 RepID=UPI0015A71026|nr:GNAT family N-acetyltransferase [Paenibacillus sp. CF384]